MRYSKLRIKIGSGPQKLVPKSTNVFCKIVGSMGVMQFGMQIQEAVKQKKIRNSNIGEGQYEQIA